MVYKNLKSFEAIQVFFDLKELKQTLIMPVNNSQNWWCSNDALSFAAILHQESILFHDEMEDTAPTLFSING